MPRTHGRIMSVIWTDEDFIALPSEPQRLYMFLLSQPDLSHAGLLPLRIRRWATKVGGGTSASVRSALKVLADSRFVLADKDTEELLIRTFVRNDGVYKQPKVMLRMREDARQIESRTLRAAFLAELDHLPLHELSDKPAGPNGDQPSTRELVSRVVDTLREDFGMAIGGVSDTPGGTHTDTPPKGYGEPSYVRAGALPLPPTPIPHPPTPVPPTAGDVASADAATTAQTLIAEWIDHCGARPPARVIGQVSKEVGAMLAENIPYADVRAGLADWHTKGLHPSTLASVVHEYRTRGARGATRKESTTDARVRDGLALAERFSEMDAEDALLALPQGETA